MLGLPQLPRTLAAAERDARHARADVRASALVDLVRLSRGVERPAAVRAIAQVLSADASAELRADAAIALADAEAHEGGEALLGALGDAHLRVKQMALLALGEVGAPDDAETLAAIAPFERADEPELRFQALIALVRLEPSQAASRIERAAGDGDGEIRAMAYRLADELWAEDDVVPESFLVRARAALSDSTSAVRGTAAVFLGARGESAAQAVLVGVIDGSIPAGTVADQQAAIELSAELGLKQAIPGLRRRAFPSFASRFPPLAWHAKVALARLGEARAEHAILSGLAGWTRETRTLAVVAAGRARLVAAREAIKAFRGDPRRADPDAVEEALSLLSAPLATKG